jgi:hypothetical protein
MLGRDRRELPDKRAFLLGLRIAPGEAVPARRGAEVARALAIEVGEGDRDLVDAAAQGRRELAEARAVCLGRCQRGDQDRVVAPDHGARSPFVSERPHLGERRPGIDHMRLERARIDGDRELDHEGRARPDLGQIRDERLDVPRPEDEARHLRRPQRDPVGWAAIGVADLGKTRLEPG